MILWTQSLIPGMRVGSPWLQIPGSLSGDFMSLPSLVLCSSAPKVAGMRGTSILNSYEKC